MEKCKIIDSEYLFKRPWLTVRKDKLLLPTGVINDEYYVLEYPTWVNVIAITKEGQYVMIEQYRHGLQDIFTELVAGVAEDGEEPIDAARRELAEETGYGGGVWELNTILSANPSTTNNLTYCFIAHDVEQIGRQHLDRTEDIGIKLLSETEVIAMLKADEMKQALMAASLWKHFFKIRVKSEE